MKTYQSFLGSKEWSKFWSSQTWQHFLTQTKHYAPECTYLKVMEFFITLWDISLFHLLSTRIYKFLCRYFLVKVEVVCLLFMKVLQDSEFCNKNKNGCFWHLKNFESGNTFMKRKHRTSSFTRKYIHRNF